jgi:flagellar M-ring protein FliF
MFNAFRGLDANRRFLVLGLAAALLVAAVFLGRQASAPTYVSLFQGLPLAEVGKMTDALTKASIPYKLDGEGTQLLVASADAARARVLLAQDGLPSEGRPGLELFDKPSWGMTDFTQHVTYRRALEGELARTIGTLKGVERAQVHIGLPESSALRRLERPAQAAVVLSLRGTEPLSPEQVRGIAQLVSNSVERLAVEDVAVLDDSGRPLSGLGGSDANSGMALSSRQLELQQTVEKHLGAKVEQLLTTAVGVGDVRVQVSARLNFDQLDRTVEAYDPQGRVLSNESRSDGGDSASAPVGGPRVINLEYKTSRTVEKLIAGVGNVTRLSVSAMVNSRALDGGKGLPDEQRAQLETLVRTAVGYDSLRGDQVTVAAVPFGGPTPEKVIPVSKEEAPTTSIIETAGKLTYPVASVLAILVALFLGLKAVRGGSAAPGSGGMPMLAGQDNSSAVLPIAATPEAAQLRTRAQSDSLAAPEASARVVRSWLAEPTA